MTRAPLPGKGRRQSGQVVGEEREAEVAVVAAAVVAAGLGAVAELVGRLAYWKKERPALFSSFGRARLSLSRANFYSDLSRSRLSFLQGKSTVLDTASTILT